MTRLRRYGDEGSGKSFWQLLYSVGGKRSVASGNTAGNHLPSTDGAVPSKQMFFNDLHKGVIGSEAPWKGQAGGGAQSKEPVEREVTLLSDAGHFRTNLRTITSTSPLP